MVQVSRSTIIDAPIEDVWSILRDFNGHDRWHPAIASSEIDNDEPVDAVGSIRHFRLRDGGELREQLLALSDSDHRLTYCLLESPLPLMGYVATIQLRPVTDGNATFWQWRSEFDPPAARRGELVKLVSEGIYQSGFDAIRALLESSRSRLPLPPDRPVVTERQMPDAAKPLVATGRDADTVRAIVVRRHGGPAVLQLEEVDLAPPGPGEVQLHHSFVGVNFIDVYCRTGYFDLLKPPGIPGMEAAGRIVSVGPGVSGFAMGERVAYACPPVGSYCERRNMSPELLVRLPEDIPEDIAAASLLKGITASFLLHDVRSVQPSEILVIHAAAGGVGQLLVQWARHIGATVIATVSTDEKARLVERLGAHNVIVYTRENFVDAVLRLTNGVGAHVVYDAVGNDTFGRSVEALGVQGHLVSFGQASGPVGDWDIGALASKSLTISRPNYGHYTDTPAKLRRHVDRFFAVLRQGIVTVEAPTRYSLSEAADAHRDLEARRTTGSLILAI